MRRPRIMGYPSSISGTRLLEYLRESDTILCQPVLQKHYNKSIVNDNSGPDTRFSKSTW